MINKKPANHCLKFLIFPFSGLFAFVPQIALAIGVLTSTRGGVGYQLWWGSGWVPLLGCHCWGAITARQLWAGLPWLGAIAWCHCWVPLLMLCWGAIAWCHGGGAIAGVHSWVPLLACHCWRAIAGCHTGVLLGAIAGRHCWVPCWDWEVGASYAIAGAIAGCHWWVPLLGLGATAGC